MFVKAIEAGDEESRAALLKTSCGEDVELQRSLEKMLEEHFTTSAFMAGPAVRELPVSEEPKAVGPYEIICRLGEGGCGVVYLAEQQEPIRRRVALKILKAGMDTASVVARFEAERQALARMDHPNIAKVFEAGATTGGRPYFVMELVEGLPLTRHCQKNHLSQRERLTLFLQVCDAVQHAHQKGIIHRDLKPSNILVTERDGPGVVRVIDFGIAKAIQGRLTERTLVTSLQQFIGTPAYMSPEQALVTSEDIDTRSDIYSLGVLLYELLTGNPPFKNEELLSAGLDEMRRSIREIEPKRPSLVRAPNSLSAELDSDLDWIVMKCLEKDRARRYQTANALAEEIRRFLRGEPISARPPSAAYRFQKFVQRYRIQVSAALFSVFVLMMATAVSAWQAIEARGERARAEQRLHNTLQLMEAAYRRVSPGLSDIIGVTKMRSELLESTSGIMDELRHDPKPSRELRSMLSTFYLQLSFVRSWLGYPGGTGRFKEGYEAALEAIRFAQPLASEAISDAQMNAMAWAEMGACFGSQGLLEFDEALDHVDRMGQWAQKVQASTEPWIANDGRMLAVWARQLRAWILLETGRARAALDEGLGATLPLMRKAAESKEMIAVWDFDSELEMLGLAHMDLGHYEIAAEYRRERLDNVEAARNRWPNHAGWLANTVHARADMMQTLIVEGKFDEAESLFQKAQELIDMLRVADPDSAGVGMLQVRILRVNASGYLAFAQKSTADPELQRAGLSKAENLLAEAESRLRELTNEQVKTYLRYGVDRVRQKLRQAQTPFTR